MTVSRIRKGNRITIPHDVMAEMDLHVGNEIYYEIKGVIGRGALDYLSHDTHWDSGTIPAYIDSATIPAPGATI